MAEKKHSTKFWAGNAVLALALAVLYFMGPLAKWIGTWAMVLWIALAALGFYLVTSDKEASISDVD